MPLSHVAGLHVGTVETCSPVEIKVLLDSDAPQDIAFNTGRPQGFPRLNGYVLIPNEGGAVVAVISRMTMEPAPPGGGERDRAIVQIPVSRRRLFVTPLGTLEVGRTAGDKAFKLSRGVASYPAVGDAVVLATADQLRSIVEASGEDRRVHIGSARLALDAPVTIDPDKLFGRHVGVFGNTGSGKSCTVAGLIRWSVETAAADGQPCNSRFIVLDPNGEYRTCFSDLSESVDVKVYSIEPGEGEARLTVPAWMWNGQEWAGVLNASPGTQRPILMQAIRRLRAATLAAGVGDDVAAADADGALTATQLRAFVEWLQGCRAEGVAALGAYPKIKACHENLQGLEDLLGRFGDRNTNAGALADAVFEAVEVSRAVRARRTDTPDHRVFHRQLQDGDLVDVIAALNAIRVLLPDVAALGGPSEDTPTRFDPTGLPGMIDLIAGLTPGNMQQHVAGLGLRIQTLLADSRVAPLIQPEDGGDEFGDWLHGLLGRGDSGKGQITVLDLSLVPSDVLTTIVSVLGRLVFEAAQRYRRVYKVTMPTVLVLEEAHNFVERQSYDTDDGGQGARCRQVFEKIAKEGRKFGVGLMLSSQRPAELSPTIVAQCNSFLLHRIVNDRDQELVTRLSPDSSGTLLKELPSLPTQKAILMGIATEIPVVFDVRALAHAHRPTSENPDFWGVWTGKRAIENDLNEIAQQWSAG